MDVDFRVEIGPAGTDGYPVIFRTTDGEEASGTLRLPPPEEVAVQAARIPDAVRGSSARVRRAAVEGEAPVRDLGRLLFDALLKNTGANRLLTDRSRAAQVRMVLQVEPPELARLPWEFMYDTDEEMYVCLGVPLVRQPQLARPMEPLGITPPLRVLGMVAVPDDQESLAVHVEQHRLQEALADLEENETVSLHWVRGQTWRELRDAVRRDARTGTRRDEWHVLHFIGHGGYDARAEEGTLALAGERGGTYWLGAGNLALLLAGHPALRLAVLNACETGRAGGLNPFSSVAGALMRKGMPAVLAMQYEVSEDAAMECTHAFYSALARKVPIDVAVMEARQAITLAHPGTLEWGTPVLYMRSLDGRIFGNPVSETGEDTRVGRKSADPTGFPELYTDGRAAAFIEDWDAAVDAFRAIVARDPDYRDARTWLGRARHQQRLAALYAAGAASATARDWDQAVKHLEAVVTAEAGYRDAAALLERAREERTRAELREVIRDLYERGQWQAVLVAAERLRERDPEGTAADPERETMLGTARAELEKAARDERLSRHYSEALDHIEDGDWARALASLGEIQAVAPDYRDTGRLVERLWNEVNATKPVTESTGPQAAERPARCHRFVVPHRVTALAFSAGGDRLAVALTMRTALVTDPSGEDRVRMRHGGLYTGVRHVCFHPDGRRIATAGGATARVWDARTGSQLREVDHGAAVYAVAFSPDGSHLATAGHDAHVRIWDVETGAELVRLRHTASVRCIAFSSDGLRLASSGADRIVRVWDIETGTRILKLELDGSVSAVAFTSDGHRLAVGGYRTASIRDAVSGASLVEVNHKGEVRGLALSPDDGYVATIGDCMARVWETDTGREVFHHAHYKGRGIAFSHDGSRLATGNDRWVRVYALEELRPHD
ncbi:CHAT domain-containing protein [Streptomyces cyanogenus]|uniref:CHAT domain-containing protein n=1 Tax=Streptomyces cyanogenus TaxID=80860 RepID=UPI001AA179A1|nr:CHAT domain-containing protein [Streptomyces cyanogenus]